MCETGDQCQVCEEGLYDIQVVEDKKVILF